MSSDYVKSAALLKEMSISLHGTITLALIDKIIDDFNKNCTNS